MTQPTGIDEASFYNVPTHGREQPRVTTRRVWGCPRGIGGMGGGDEGVMVIWVKGVEILKARLDAYWLYPSRLERLWAILSIILERLASGNLDGDYCPISCRLLEEQVGRDFSYSGIHKLLEIGALECDGMCAPKKKCLGYRFSPEFAACPAQPVRLSARLSQLILNQRLRKSLRAVIDNPTHQFLWESLDRLELHPSWRDHLPPESKSGKEQLRRDAWTLSGEFIDQRRWSFSTDPKSGRVFNNITWLSKELRKLALIDGLPCAEIDIGNSQPYFLSQLYLTRNDEAQKYAKIVSDGQFYETVNREAGLPMDERDREKLKKAVFSQVLFGKKYASSALYSAFERLFPELASHIEQYKKQGRNVLPIQLQRAEASVVIEQIVPQLAARLPGTHFLTVHDSLIMPFPMVDAAKEMLDKALVASTGIKPHLRIKNPPEELLMPVSDSAA